MNNQSYRENYREARNAQKRGTDSHERVPRPMPVGRGPSGKINSYMLWLNIEGRRRFFNTYGHSYNDKNPEDKGKMSNFWANVPHEQKEELKNREKESNVVPLHYLQRRKQLNKIRRAAQHANIARHGENWKSHKQFLLEQRQVRQEAVPSSHGIPNIHVDDDLNSFCNKNADRARNAIRASLRTGRMDGGENVLWSPDHVYQFVSIAPLIYTYKMALNRLASYPAEISITTFHLKTGLRETQTRFIEYDPEWFHGNEPEDEATGNNRRDYANVLNIPEDGMTADNAMDPNVAMEWLHEKITQCKSMRILCDKNAFNFVFYGLKLLAKYTGHNAVHYFKNVLMEQIVSIQDFTQALLEEAPLIMPRSNMWSREQINNAFMFYDLIPCSDQNRICPTHAAMTTSHKLNCTGAHSARMLQNFFYIIRQNKLADIHNYCDGPAHRPCQVIPTEMKETLYNARTISREEEQEYKRRIEMRKKGPQSTRLTEELPEPASDEPINELISSDESDDEEDKSDDESYQDFYNGASSSSTHRPGPSQSWNPYGNVNPSESTLQDNFISGGRVDPDQIGQRRGVRDLAIPEENATPTFTIPSNPIPTATVPNTVPNTTSGYKPYGIIPKPESYETPQLKTIIRNSESYFSRMPSHQGKGKVYKEIKFSCF